MKEFSIDDKVHILNLDLDKLSLKNFTNKFKELSKFPSSRRDFVPLQRQLLWLYIKKEKPTWLRYAKNGLDRVKPHITDDDERQVFRQLGLMPNSEWKKKYQTPIE